MRIRPLGFTIFNRQIRVKENWKGVNFKVETNIIEMMY